MKTLDPKSLTPVQRKMAEAGYGTSVPDEGHGLVITIQGGTGVGKTGFALGGQVEGQMGAPGPLAYINFDEREDGTIQKARDAGRVIYPATFPVEIPPFADPKDRAIHSERAEQIRTQVWSKFVVAATAAPSIGMRSVVIDTEGECWALRRLSEAGRILKVPESAYPEINQDYIELFKKIRRSGVVLVIIRHVKEETLEETDEKGYKKLRRTGRMLPEGMKKITQIADACIEVLYEPPYRTNDKIVKEQRFGVRILEAKQNKGMIGRVIWGIDFPSLACLLKPAVDADAWEDA